MLLDCLILLPEEKAIIVKKTLFNYLKIAWQWYPGHKLDQNIFEYTGKFFIQSKYRENFETNLIHQLLSIENV